MVGSVLWVFDYLWEECGTAEARKSGLSSHYEVMNLPFDVTFYRKVKARKHVLL